MVQGPAAQRGVTMDRKSNCHVYGYAGHDMKLLHLGALVNKDQTWSKVEDPDLRKYWYCPVSKEFLTDNSDILCQWVTSSKTVENFLGERASVPLPGSSLYFNRLCRTPRGKFNGIYRHVSSPAKADAVVIPAFRTWNVTHHCMIFVNDNAGQVWIYEEASGDNYWKLGYDKSLGVGNTVTDFCRTMNPSHYKHNIQRLGLKDSPLLDAKCVHVGSVFGITAGQIPLLEALLGIYPKIVFEDSLLKSLPENTTDEVSVETVSNLYGLLNSETADNAKMALKTLASLNYTGKYRTTFCLLLDMTAVNWYQCRNVSSSVKEMCRVLGYTGKWESFRPKWYYTVTEDEKEQFAWLYNIQIEHRIKDTVEQINSRTNVNVSLEYNVKMSM